MPVLQVGAFVGGLMLSNSPLSHQIMQTIEPVRNLFAALFLSCIGVGRCLEPPHPGSLPCSPECHPLMAGTKTLKNPASQRSPSPYIPQQDF